ncbi:MAG: hypothetical protein DME07_06960 [Candidatus Rokuibacteriota bacterium]|nr:MAG: hypothetical protein DME07_06960 [Candidatus Rokubacteria bacterium]PYN52871.1 MAG: hypothetical protein DMD94_20690 [Candidatus Rokubacteria bacterium]
MTMSVIEHKGWQIESRSYQTNADCWCPRALVSLFEGERVSTHDVRALLTVTFDTAPEADNFAVMMAKMWITERENRPQWASCPRRPAGRLDGQDVADHRRGHEAGAKRGVGRLPRLPRLIRSLLFGAAPFQRYAGLPALARVVDRRRHSWFLASS